MIRLIPKDKKLKKNKKLQAYINAIMNEAMEEFTMDKITDVIIGYPYKLSWVDGKVKMEIIKDWYAKAAKKGGKG